VFLFGYGGKGKSSILKQISNSKDFIKSDKIKGLVTDDKIIISTPDIGDGHDILNVANVIKCLKELKYINSFIIVQNIDD